jgi:L-ascorbate metabolism protein UlaG (beta-lactamase superfamily)
MRIEWLGHACFKITHHDYAIVLDPYNPQMMKGYAPIDTQAQAVLCSHNHGDHNFVAAVNIVSSDQENPFVIKRLTSFHDDVKGAKRGSNVITILEADGLRVAHLGDLGVIPDEEQLHQLLGLDAMMIPVGGYYTIDAPTAKTIVELTKPKVIIPMHYRGVEFGPPVLATVDSFTSLFAKDFVRFVGSNVIELTSSTVPQIAVLTYLP